jgi:spore germination protein GerM
MNNKKMLLICLALVAAAVVFGAYSYFTAASRASEKVRIYFFKEGKLAAVERPASPELSPLRQAIFDLLSGPNEREKAAGYSSLIPKQVGVISILYEKDMATIDLSGAPVKDQGGVAQIVYTATEIPGVKKVKLGLAQSLGRQNLKF